jgi:hypothetical protein
MKIIDLKFIALDLKEEFELQIKRSIISMKKLLRELSSGGF